MAVVWIEVPVKWLSVYVYRAVPLLSLLMHLILAVFSNSRRREDKGWKRVFVWVTYQLTDWGPAYVIGNLYIETSPGDKTMIAIWVPFLLLHHARPDNISAYAIEDSKLWRRLLLLDIPLSLGSVFIVFRYILAECTAGYFLCWASGIMLPLGILKYVESMLALWRTDLGHIRGSRLSNKKTFKLDDYRDQEKLSELEDEEALLVAHDLFEICKGAFCDYKANIDQDDVISMFSGRWESMCKVVEMELSLMYDILYTKALVVHTWHGYAIHVVSPPLTATALLLFFLHCKEGMRPIDKNVSYILLWTTLLLDVRWLFRALASAWIHSYFKCMPHNWLKHALWCQRGWKKLRYSGVSLFLSWLSLWFWTCACPKEPKSYRRWPGIFGQCNLLSQSTAGNRHNLYCIPRPAIEWEGQSILRDFKWEDHSRGLGIPDSVKKLVFQNIWEKLFRDPVELKKHEQPSNSKKSPPSPPVYDKRCPSCGKLLEYCTCKGSSNLDEHCPSCGEIPNYCTCHPSSPSPDKDCFGVSCGPARPPGCRNLPNYCTCVHPGSLDPGGHCLGILYGPPGTPCPRERICNRIDDEPALCPQYPREWICNGVEDQAAPWLQYPRERICVGVNNEPPRLPYPWQVRAGITNAPFEEDEYHAQARPHHHPDEQAAEYSLGPYEQQTDRWRYDRALPQSYEQTNPLRRVHTSSSYARVLPDTKSKGQSDQGQSDEDMGFPPELQEAILIWHIATNVFLLYSCSSSPRITGEESKEQAKAIEQMSDYMMFLVASRPKMLPGLTLQSLHERARCAVVEIWKVAKPTSYTTQKKDVVAMWMLGNRDNLNDPNFGKGIQNIEKSFLAGPGMTIVRAGTELAGKLLGKLSKGGKSKINKEVADMVKGLEHWIPRLQELPSKEIAGMVKGLEHWDMKDMLKFILEAWVRPPSAHVCVHAVQQGFSCQATQLLWRAYDPHMDHHGTHKEQCREKQSPETFPLKNSMYHPLQ